MNSDRTSRDTLIALARRWWIACFAAFLLLCKHLKMYTNESIRYQAFWGTSDALAFAIDILLLGTLLFLAYQLAVAMKAPWIRRVAQAAFVVVIGLCLVGYPRTGWRDAAYPWLPAVSVVLTCAFVMLGILIATRWGGGASRSVRSAALIFSPAMLIVVGQLFSYPKFSITVEDMPPPPARSDTGKVPGGSAANVYIVIFDQWSYARTFRAGQVLDDFPNMAQFAQNATTYHDAHSPFPETMRSLPGILFQTENEYQCRDGVIGFEHPEAAFDEVSKVANLFSAGRTNGYRTYMIGVTHPYRRMFGDELDYCYTPAAIWGNADDRQLGASMFRHLAHGLAASSMAVPKPAAIEWRLTRFWQRVCQSSSLKHDPRTLASVHQLALEVIGRQSGPSLCVFHYPVPHDPYIYSRHGLNPEACRNKPLVQVPKGDGTFTLPDSKFTIARYVDNLRYTDTLLGELIAALVSAGKYDESLIILTSDHNWTLDPELVDDRTKLVCTHVPLLIKHPHQTAPRKVGASFHLADLHTQVFAPRQLAQVNSEV